MSCVATGRGGGIEAMALDWETVQWLHRTLASGDPVAQQAEETELFKHLDSSLGEPWRRDEGEQLWRGLAAWLDDTEKDELTGLYTRYVGHENDQDTARVAIAETLNRIFNRWAATDAEGVAWARRTRPKERGRFVSIMAVNDPAWPNWWLGYDSEAGEWKYAKSEQRPGQDLTVWLDQKAAFLQAQQDNAQTKGRSQQQVEAQQLEPTPGQGTPRERTEPVSEEAASTATSVAVTLRYEGKFVHADMDLKALLPETSATAIRTRAHKIQDNSLAGAVRRNEAGDLEARLTLPSSSLEHLNKQCWRELGLNDEARYYRLKDDIVLILNRRRPDGKLLYDVLDAAGKRTSPCRRVVDQRGEAACPALAVGRHDRHAASYSMRAVGSRIRIVPVKGSLSGGARSSSRPTGGIEARIGQQVIPLEDKVSALEDCLKLTGKKIDARFAELAPNTSIELVDGIYLYKDGPTPVVWLDARRLHDTTAQIWSSAGSNRLVYWFFGDQVVLAPQGSSGQPLYEAVKFLGGQYGRARCRRLSQTVEITQEASRSGEAAHAWMRFLKDQRSRRTVKIVKHL